MNSTSVAGGAPPAPSHFNFPPQSPVTHLPAPEASKLHPVRPQIRPDQPGDAVTVTIDPGAKANPVSLICGPLPVRSPGQTVKLQWFVTVKVVPETMEIVPTKYTIRKKLVRILVTNIPIIILFYYVAKSFYEKKIN